MGSAQLITPADLTICSIATGNFAVRRRRKRAAWARRVYDGTVTRTQTTLCVVLVLALALVGISPARADDTPTVAIAIASVSPEHVTPENAKQQVIVKGTITNTTSQPLFWMDAALWHHPGPLTSFDLIDAAIDTDANAPIGARHVPGAALVKDKPLAPGAKATFELRAPVSSLGIRTNDLAAIVGIQVRAATPPTGTRQLVGQRRVLLPLASSPFEVVDLNLIATKPGALPNSKAMPPAVVQAFLDPLTPQLERAEHEDVITAIDPATYQAVRFLALSTTKPTPQAVDFLQRLDTLLHQHKLWRLPPGNPNLARVPKDLRSNVASWSDDLTQQQLADAPSVVLTPQSSLAGKGFDHVIAYGTHNDRIRYFSLTPQASPTVIDELPAPRQQQLPLPGSTRWAEVDAMLAQAQSHTPIREALTSGESGDAIPADIRQTQLAAYSMAFPSQAESLAFLNSVPEITFDPATIGLSASRSFVMGERTSEFPATITNPTQVAIWVRLVFFSDNPQRITVPDSDVVRVGPGESQTLRVQPKATSNGVTSVHAHLIAADGTRLAPAAEIEITSTEYGRVGWIIIIISGAVVLGGTVWRIRSVQRERSKESSESGQ